MKKLLLILLCVPMMGSGLILDSLKNHNHTHNEKIEDVVYVCSGLYAYAYHSTINCRGLNNCKGEKYYMTSYEAKSSKWNYRKPCCICIGGYGCKNDVSSGYGGGGGGGDDDDVSEAMAYVFIVVAAASALILSNEFYIGTANPLFIDGKFHSPMLANATKGNVDDALLNSLVIQLEKNFKDKNDSEVSSLEYGFRSYSWNLEGSRWTASDYGIEGEWFLNYKHNFIVSNPSYGVRPHNGFVFYAGPTLDFLVVSEKVLPGFVAGSYYQFHPRLKINLGIYGNMHRAVYQLGLSWTYQYKMFWN